MADVLVVGGCAIDLKATSAAPLVPETSNPGFTSATPGGVGRNIAENLARLGTSVRLVSRVGDDPFGRLVHSETIRAGVDMAGVHSDAERTPTYVAVLDSDGSLDVAVADFGAIDTMTPDHLNPRWFSDVDQVVLDANLPLPVIAAAISEADRVGAMTTLETVSVAKARRLVQLYERGLAVHLITPNEDEYAALAEEIDPLLLASWVCVRRGARGSRLLVGTSADPLDIPAVAVPDHEIRDVTGAGDSATAGLIHALVHGGGLEEAVAFGHTVAAHTVRSDLTVSPDLADVVFTPAHTTAQEDP